MPKEIIRHAGSETIKGELSWSRDGQYVQLTTGLDVVVHHDGTEDTPAFDDAEFQAGAYVQLDRKGLNDLIRIARRARNAVFGADE